MVCLIFNRLFRQTGEINNSIFNIVQILRFIWFPSLQTEVKYLTISLQAEG